MPVPWHSERSEEYGAPFQPTNKRRTRDSWKPLASADGAFQDEGITIGNYMFKRRGLSRNTLTRTCENASLAFGAAVLIQHTCLMMTSCSLAPTGKPAADLHRLKLGRSV